MWTNITIEVERDSDWRCKENYKKKSGAYVSSGNCENDLRMDALLTKIVKGLEN